MGSLLVEAGEACKNNQIETLQKKLKECEIRDINPFSDECTWEGQSNLFHIAASSETSSLKVLEELITSFRLYKGPIKGKGSGINGYLHRSLNSERYTALHCACKSNKVDYVYVFVKELRFIGISSSYKYTPFEVACIYGKTEVASILLKLCPKEYEDFSSGLILALNQPNQATTFVHGFIKKLCKEHKVTVKVLNSFCSKEYYNLVKFCIDEKLCKEDSIKSLAVAASSQNVVDLLKYFVKHKPNLLNNKTVSRMFHIAASKNQLSVINFLLKKNSQLGKLLLHPNKKGEAPLQILLANTSIQDILPFCQKELEMNILHIICYKCSLQHSDLNSEHLSQLAEAEASLINQKDAFGNTPPQYAFKMLKKAKLTLDHNFFSTTFNWLKEMVQNPNCAVFDSDGESLVYLTSRLLFYDKAKNVSLRSQVANFLDVCLQNPMYDSTSLSNDVLVITKYFFDEKKYTCSEFSKTLLEIILPKLLHHHQFDPNVCIDCSGDGILHIAARYNHIELVAYILTNFANLKNCTAVQAVKASSTNSLVIYQELIKHGADIPTGSIDPYGNSLLHFACKAKSVNLIALLSTSCAAMLYPNEKGETPFHILCKNQNANCLKRLLSCPNVDVHNPVDCFEVFISKAKMKENISKAIKYSLRAIVNHPSFQLQVYKKDNDFIQLCCKFGASDLVIDKISNPLFFKDRETLDSLLHIACRNCNVNAINSLLYQYQIPIGILNKFNQTPFHSLISQLYIHVKDINKILAAYEALVKHDKFSSVLNLKTEDGSTALHMLCNSFDKVKVLLFKELIQNSFINPNIKDLNGDSPLLLACKNLLPEHVELLLACPSIGVNIKNDKNITAFDAICNYCNDLEKLNKQQYNALLKIHKMLIDHKNFDIESGKIQTLICENYSKILKHEHSILYFLPENSKLTEKLINKICTDDGSLLHFAFKQLSTTDIKFLLRNYNSFDLQQKNSIGETAFHIALKFAEAHEIFLQLMNYATYNDSILSLQDKDGNTCLHLVCQTSQLLLFHKIISKFNDLNLVNNEGKTAMHIACERKNIDMITALLDTGQVDLTIQDNEGNSPIHCLLLSCSRSVIDNVFLEKVSTSTSNLSFLQQNYEGDSILHLALQSSESVIDFIFSLFLDESDYKLQNNLEETPLHNLAYSSPIKFHQYCILQRKVKFDLTIADNDGMTPLHIACLSKFKGLENSSINQRIFSSLELTFPDNIGNTALHSACHSGNIYYIELLSSQMTDIGLQNDLGDTPLHVLLARNQDKDLVENCFNCLCNHSSFSPNIQNKSGLTLLHLACLHKHLTIVEQLLKLDGINIKCGKEHVAYFSSPEALELIMKRDNSRHQVLVNMFLSSHHIATTHTNMWIVFKKKYSITACSIIDNDGNTPLHLACKILSFPLIKAMLKSYKRKIEAIPVNKFKQTPLHLLVHHLIQSKMKPLELKKKLKILSRYDWVLLFKVGMNKQDKDGNTVLHYICQEENVLLLQLFSSCGFSIRNNKSQLPLAIAQETGNTSFFLQVLVKYFEKQGSKEVANYYKTVLEEEAISIKLVKCILTGPPGVGKTSLKQRLLGNGPLEVLNSTGISESPLTLTSHPTVRDVSLSNATVSVTEWSLIDCRDQALALLDIVSNDAYNVFQEIPKKLPNVSQDAVWQPNQLAKPFKSQFKLKSNKIPVQKLTIDEKFKISRRLANSVCSKKEKKTSKKEKKTSRKEKATKQSVSATGAIINDSPLLSIIDTGGQPELNELLPAFVTGPVINLIVFRLNQPLDKQYPICYRKVDKTNPQSSSSVKMYESFLTQEEMIFRSLSSIASLGNGFQLTPDDECIQDPIAFLIATHKDIPDINISKTNEHLKAVIKSGDSHFNLSNIINYCNDESVIFAVNNLAVESKEFDFLRKKILDVIEKKFVPLPIPLTWLFFSIELQNLTNNKIKKSVLSIEECLKIAQRCGIMTEIKLKRVLWFFHNAMGIVMYFTKIPELESLVILDLQIVFDCLTELISSCFLLIGSHSADDFFKKGQFTKSNLKEVIKCNEKISESFTAEQMIALYLHLHIISHVKEDIYFMPAALKPTSRTTGKSISTSCPPPLLVSFKCGYSPTGVFTSLVAYLLSKRHWKLTDSQHYRNMISFEVGPSYDEVTLIARPTYFEVLFCRKHSQDFSSLAEDCQAIRKDIDCGIYAVTETLHYKYNSEHFFGFICSCGSSPTHPVIYEYEEPKLLAKCILKQKILQLNADSHLLWYGQNTEQAIVSDKVDSSLSQEVLNKIIEIEDLDEVFGCLAHFNEWPTLGLKLGLYKPTLDKIKRENPERVDDQKMEMLSCWLSRKDKVVAKGGPTWNQLITALRNIKDGPDVAGNIIKYLQQQSN